MPCRNVWYRLFESSTSQQYSQTNADKVSLSESEDVADFREAVQSKWDKPGYLKDIPAGALTVYANKSAFDKRNAVEDTVQPLEEDSLIGNFGLSKDDALIVVVRSPILAELDTRISCDIPFYKYFVHAEVSDEWISFDQFIPMTTLKKLYIRESYISILSDIMHAAKSCITPFNVTKVIITGTPGIGKSLFIIYLLHKLVKEGKRVLFIYHPYNIYYDGQGGVFELLIIPSPSIHSFWKKDLWCLFDAKSKKEEDLNKLPYGNCNFVLSTSPRRELVNDFKKPPVPQVFYMPTWTETELEAIAPLFTNLNTWRDRFEFFGGIPRTLFEDLRYEPRAMLNTACAQFTLENYVSIVDIESSITEHSKVIHSLVHIKSTTPYTQSSVCYASQKAIEIIAQKLNEEAKRKLLQLVSSYEGSPLTAALCGYIFESYALKILEKGGTFRCRPLIKKNSKTSKTDETWLNVQQSERKVVDKVENNQIANQLYVPKRKNYPALDAWIPGIGGFQITVAKTHKLNDSVKDDLPLLGHGANKLYWILHPMHHDDFTCSNSVEGIEQYAVRLAVENDHNTFGTIFNK